MKISEMTPEAQAFHERLVRAANVKKIALTALVFLPGVIWAILAMVLWYIPPASFFREELAQWCLNNITGMAEWRDEAAVAAARDAWSEYKIKHSVDFD